MVYLIYSQNNHQLKIGYSKNPEKRLKQLSTSTSDTLYILKLLNGDKYCEKSLHYKFRHYCINREWFSYQQIILDEFDRLSIHFPIDKDN